MPKRKQVEKLLSYKQLEKHILFGKRFFRKFKKGYKFI
jgi:hypothetical protein